MFLYKNNCTTVNDYGINVLFQLSSIIYVILYNFDMNLDFEVWISNPRLIKISR